MSARVQHAGDAVRARESLAHRRMRSAGGAVHECAAHDNGQWGKTRWAVSQLSF
jgi:hypothetical protein